MSVLTDALWEDYRADTVAEWISGFDSFGLLVAEVSARIERDSVSDELSQSLDV